MFFFVVVVFCLKLAGCNDGYVRKTIDNTLKTLINVVNICIYYIAAYNLIHMQRNGAEINTYFYFFANKSIFFKKIYFFSVAAAIFASSAR
eukprot:UN10956